MLIEFLQKHARAIKLSIAMFFVIVAGVLVYYAANHGRILVEIPSGLVIKQISYCTTPCVSLKTFHNYNSEVIEKGKYVVSIQLENSYNYVTEVTVGRFLTKTVVKPKYKSYGTETFSTIRSQQILPVGNNLLAFDLTKPAKLIGDSNHTPIQIDERPIVAANYVDKDNLLLITENTYSQTYENIPSRAFSYNLTTKKTLPLGNIQSKVTPYNIYYGTNSVYVVDGKNRKITKITKDAISELVIPQTVELSESYDIPIMAFGDNSVAILSGNNFYQTSGDDVSPPPKITKSSIVTLYSLKDFSKINDIDLGKRNDIHNLSLSPDNQYIVVITESSLSTYSISNKTNLLNSPAVTIDKHIPMWVDNNSFVYPYNTGGVYRTDINTQESYSVINQDLFRISSITGVVDNKIYLTSMSTKGSSVKEPKQGGGVIIDLSDDITDIINLPKNSIIKRLPYSDIFSNIDYKISRAGVSISITTAPKHNISALKSIESMGYNPSDYTISYQERKN